MELSSKVISDDSPTARLYEQHGPALFAYLRHRLRSQESAEDALVEVFVAALESDRFGALSEKEQVGWLWRVARNKSVDMFRRAQVRRGLDLNLVEEPIDDHERSPERIVLRQEESALLHRHLAQLPVSQQHVIRLRFAHGLRSAEIARVLDKPEGTVRSLLSRALNFLRTRYQIKEQEGQL